MRYLISVTAALLVWWLAYRLLRAWLIRSAEHHGRAYLELLGESHGPAWRDTYRSRVVTHLQIDALWTLRQQLRRDHLRLLLDRGRDASLRRDEGET